MVIPYPHTDARGPEFDFILFHINVFSSPVPDPSGPPKPRGLKRVWDWTMFSRLLLVVSLVASSNFKYS